MLLLFINRLIYMILLMSIWKCRGIVFGSVQREFQIKYRNSLLGAAWVIINPMAMIFVYTIIFSEVMHAKFPGLNSKFGYSIYLCAGTLIWGLFTEIVLRSSTTFLENAHLLKKLSFPRVALPLIIITTAGLNFSIIFGLFTVFLLLTGSFPGLIFLAVLPLTVITVALAAGLGMTLGVLNVFFRDVGQFLGVFMQFWFWLTPIVYSVELLPDSAQILMLYNPIASVVKGFQTVLVAGQWPDWSSLTSPTVLGLLSCIFGIYFFRRHTGDIIDEL
jgi:lipopolysaccharide transport system permease protein